MSFDVQEEETWPNLQKTHLLFPVVSQLIHSGHVQFLTSEQSFGVWLQPFWVSLLEHCNWEQFSVFWSDMLWAADGDDLGPTWTFRPHLSFEWWKHQRQTISQTFILVTRRQTFKMFYRRFITHRAKNVSLILQASKFKRCYNVMLDICSTSVTAV